MTIIPAIDLRDGRCVRLYKGDFDRQTDYDEDPEALARTYGSMGFGAIHLVDLDGAKVGTQGNQEVLQRIVGASTLTAQVGGGIRNQKDLDSWFVAGVERVVIGSLAVTEPDLVCDWLRTYGPDKIVLAFDVNIGTDDTPRVATHGWTQKTELSLWQCIDRYVPAGLQHVLCTDISRDGAMAGPSLALYEEVLERYPDIQLQASGGVRSIDDLDALQAVGVPAAITGRALLDGRISAEEVATFLLAA